MNLQELYYCARAFHRKFPGTDVTKVLEAVERMVLELEDEGHETQDQWAHGTEEAIREVPTSDCTGSKRCCF